MEKQFLVYVDTHGVRRRVPLKDIYYIEPAEDVLRVAYTPHNIFMKQFEKWGQQWRGFTCSLRIKKRKSAYSQCAAQHILRPDTHDNSYARPNQIWLETGNREIPLQTLLDRKSMDIAEMPGWVNFQDIDRVARLINLTRVSAIKMDEQPWYEGEKKVATTACVDVFFRGDDIILRCMGNETYHQQLLDAKKALRPAIFHWGKTL